MQELVEELVRLGANTQARGVDLDTYIMEHEVRRGGGLSNQGPLGLILEQRCQFDILRMVFFKTLAWHVTIL